MHNTNLQNHFLVRLLQKKESKATGQQVKAEVINRLAVKNNFILIRDR